MPEPLRPQYDADGAGARAGAGAGAGAGAWRQEGRNGGVKINNCKRN